MSADANGLGCDPVAAADFLRALAHPARLQILCRLHEGETSVSTFETELGLKQPNLSQQLGQLREAGLVATRREAKSVFYRLADDKVRAILAALRSAFSASPLPDTAGRHQPRAGQRPAVLAEAAGQAPGASPRRWTRANGECGVFSVAGWDLAEAPKQKREASNG